MTNHNIVLLPGDGIGPEIIPQAQRVLDVISAVQGHTFSYSAHLMGGCAIDVHGCALSEETLKACQSADAVLLGAVGGPKWDNPDAKVRPEQGLLALRKGLGVYANLRPVTIHPNLVDASPIRPERLQGVDMIVVRELTGGLYFGQPKERRTENGHEQAVDTMFYQDFEIERILHMAFRLAEKRRAKVTSVDKSNVLETSRLWRKIATEIGKEYPHVTLEHMLVDTAAMRLVTTPAAFDVLVTENMFGDILTDEASVLSGSMGNMPSASLGDAALGLYEPIHGSAPDIAGYGIANPIGMILSAAMMLRYSFGLEQSAKVIENAVYQTISDGFRSADLGGDVKTHEMTDAILSRMRFKN